MKKSDVTEKSQVLVADIDREICLTLSISYQQKFSRINTNTVLNASWIKNLHKDLIELIQVNAALQLAPM